MRNQHRSNPAPSTVSSSVRTRDYLTTLEIDALMAAARQSSRYGHRDATMILLGYRHGLRAAELWMRYERFLSIIWVLGTVGGLAALVWMVRRGPRVAESLRLGPVNAGIILGAVTLTVVWAVALPFGLAAEWWQRRHGISTESYGSE